MALPLTTTLCIGTRSSLGRRLATHKGTALSSASVHLSPLPPTRPLRTINAKPLPPLNLTCGRPEDTPFEDGVFKLTMHFSEDYPNKAPVVKFVTRLFHPNGEASLLASTFNFGPLCSLR
jgi:hypothetical protein